LNTVADPQFWNQLLARSDAIAGIDGGDDDPRQQLLAQLETLAEQYRHAFDPVDDFEAFVTVALCRSVATAVAALKS
jgi:hypothetical protein